MSEGNVSENMVPSATIEGDKFQLLYPQNQLVSVKLSETNFLIWKTQVFTAIKGYGLENFISEHPKKPDMFIDDSSQTLSPTFSLWNRQDQILASWILSSLSESILPLMIGLNSSSEIWSVLERNFASQSKAKTLQYKLQLQTTKKGNSSMRDYLAKIKMCCDLLATTGNAVSQSDQIMHILSGLGSEYDPVMVTVTAGISSFGLNDIQALLLSFEARLESASTANHGGMINSEGSQPTANYALQDSNQKKGFNNQSFNQRGRGSNNNSFRGRGGRGSYRGRGGRHQNKVTCQVCNVSGHTADRCWYRFDQSYGTQGSYQNNGGEGLTQNRNPTLNMVHMPNGNHSSDDGWLQMGNGHNEQISHIACMRSQFPAIMLQPRTSQFTDPVFNGERAKTYPFKLDPFQEISVSCLERKESVLVSAHTSAGKTAVAEYAIAMAFRDKQRVIYTSPLKALSNQKYRELSQEFSDVGLMTGDVTLSPNASCLVMTTEILRGMLYRGSEVLKEVAWVVFDEIHYMKDRERGVVWEESIIFLPPAIKMVFLSATMSNATQFAEWICNIHKQPCHVVYTDFRPTPLQHYVFPVGGSGLYLVVDENEQFKEDNFLKLQDSFTKQNLSDGKKGATGRSGGRIGKGGTASGGGSDIYKIVKMIMERKFQPVIIFSFSRRECEQHAMSMSKLDFNTHDEKEIVEQVFRNAIQCLNEEDRNLPAIELMFPLLQRGIAVHHSGLLPIIKELVELLFQEGLVEALFATETFAMGLNMPAKTVVFTSVKKWDGDSHRYIGSGEYIQMSGRAGRRGKDERGICIIMVDDKMEMETLKDMVLGKPAPLLSTFRLSYYSILNLMSRAEGQFTAEHVIRHSFHQFQHEKTLPDIEKKVSQLEEEAATIDATGEAEVAEYHRLKLEMAQLEKKMMTEITQPERVLSFLLPGRLVKVREGGTDWGWGVVINVVKKTPPASSSMPAALASSCSNSYIVDTLLHCSLGSSKNGSQPKPCPPCLGEKGEMHVVPVQLPLLSALSKLRISIPSDLRPKEARQDILDGVQELEKCFPQGLPKLNPVKDMGIEDPELVDLANQIEEHEQKLFSHPLHKSEDELQIFKRKAEVNHQIQQLKSKMRESQLQKFRDELKNRSRVLKRLGHIDGDGVVQLKGRAACLIDTGDELLVTELMFNGTFNDLDHHQVAALASCFIPGDRSSEQIHLRAELNKPLQQLQDSARRIAEIQRECKLEVNVDEYVEASVRPFVMDYCWSKGATFAEIIQMTDIFEGSVIRLARRLDEFLNQLKAAAHAVGEVGLEDKFAAASESLRRGIMFANSLYL
ncbi:Helix-loop-helix protein 2 [Castilleja foliolosa]|uniref:RNA helicase n=1 Tax=Castilleja foliolosa TaxID=1961234 RepID=A0ABD3DPN2_9LAMI